MNELNRQSQEECADEVLVQLEEAVQSRELTPEEFRTVAGGPSVVNN